MTLTLAHAGESFTISTKMKKTKKYFTSVCYRKLDERGKENEAPLKNERNGKRVKEKQKIEMVKYRKSVLLCVTEKIIENLDFTVITYK